MNALYDRIGLRYDATRKADRHIVGRLSHHLRVREGERYIDVACGTGNYTIALASLGACMTGVDSSRRMLEAARAKAPSEAWPDWRLAEVETMPFATGQFAGAICTLAIHHFPDLARAFAEVGRVLDSVEGRFVLFTSTPEQMSRYWLGRYFPRMMRRSAQQMPSLAAVAAALADAGLGRIGTETYDVEPNLEDLFLYSGKHRPQLYLDPGFRAGISSFARASDQAEVDIGLSRLAGDIESGRIADVIGDALNDGGDYLIVSAERSP